MKKILIPILIMAIAISLFGCEAANVHENENLSIIATNFPIYDFTRQVIKDVQGVEVKMLLPLGAESHDFEPTPQDIIAITDCDLFIYIGGESDVWVDGVLANIDKEINTLKLIDFVELEYEPETIGEQDHDDHDDHEHDHETDEHIWTSIENAKKMASTITDKISEKDKLNELSYRLNCEFFTQQLSELDDQFKAVVAQGKRKTLVFADRFPFVYFAKEYGLEYFAAFPGCASEVEASAATVAELIDKVNSEEIPVVFYIEFSNQMLADTVIEATGAKKMLFNTAHNVTQADFDAGITYLEIMQSNLEALREALK
ncbi:MAG: zinc ABC transporter substrate-binding protein [Clostridiales bacterium]|nr:zinc ABC transporter substrate-binding protein [Clostridiales bacterium]